MEALVEESEVDEPLKTLSLTSLKNRTLRKPRTEHPGMRMCMGRQRPCLPICCLVVFVGKGVEGERAVCLFREYLSLADGRGCLQDMVNKAGLSDKIAVDSAGTDSWHVGERAHPGTRKVLAQHGIDYDGRSRQTST